MNTWQRIVQGAQHDIASFRAFRVGRLTGTPPVTNRLGITQEAPHTPQQQWASHVAGLAKQKLVSTANHHMGKYRNYKV